MVLCSIGLVSGLSYFELSRTTEENASVRIDRAARAAVAILCFGTDRVFHPQFDAKNNPVSLRIATAPGVNPLAPDEKLDQLVKAIGLTNQGAANLFAWSPQTSSFDRFATTFTSPDGGPPAAFSIGEGHPAYASLAAGRPFTGEVPVQGRLRLAYMTPILAESGKVAGALAVDVGWVDDLNLAENRLKTRITSAAIVILTGVILMGGIFLRFELRPLRQLARTADDLAAGTQPQHIPFTDRLDEIGDLAHGLERVTDLQDKLQKLAYTDPVTTAGNRARYFSDLNNALKRAKDGKFRASLIHLDFNGFAKINDTFGQQVGNRVLLQAYARLANIFGPSAQIARISADDFCILLPFDAQGAIAEDYAIQAIEMLSVPFHMEEGEIRVEPSIGIALLPQDAHDAETAHRVAGLALRAAKESKNARHIFFSAPLNERVQTEMLVETLLRAALKTGQLELHYQPQICPADDRLIGLEALVRWPNEKRGYIPPGEFIPIAEKTGLILELGQYVLERACKQAAAWRQAGFDFGQVSVNVSPLQFRQPSFASTVRQMLSAYRLPAPMLCLELTENVFVDTGEQMVLDILSELQNIGVQLSLDDFGSGYSSLSYLHRLPFQELKIDRAFLADADRDLQKEQLFQAIVGLGRSLGLRVIAEGAETAGEYALTAAHHCDGMQGFFCSPAVAAQDVRARIEAFHKSRPARSDRMEKKRA
ncbi:bifunctional diguanylate cyclase/phosphodiesterase [Roseibium marinum]|uniref:Diguanylate cyclase (GGDEF)-like protein n=1 Tax=Roseibium marinum TaxID=281252 RepID=A0A2S3UV96_9HYPH|nr:EAL domain-containing protein [Roseibium marinum]POF31652.1 diguanylate cyclase (GGDEF)-like protein [Roseibium marinum]